MEMTNELNKFLSYIHMGTSVYRIYYDESEKFEDESLSSLIKEIMENTFKLNVPLKVDIEYGDNWYQAK